jgi:TonB family protein
MKTLWSGAGLAATLLTAACAASAAAQTRSQPTPPVRAQVASPSARVGELVPFWLVRPAYPPIARSAFVQGVVIVALTVAADGRVQSAVIERDIPLLSQVAVEAARDSGFICRGCTGPMTYRLTYAFAAVDVTGGLDGSPNSIQELEAARTEVTPTAATLHVLVEALPWMPRRTAASRSPTVGARGLTRAI